MTKLEKLVEIQGSPAICINEGCDFTCEMEPDQDRGWHEVCEPIFFCKHEEPPHSALREANCSSHNESQVAFNLRRLSAVLLMNL
jgi:hypothetical protein